MCVRAMPVTGAVVAKFHPVPYGGSFRFSFVLTSVSKSFGYRISLQRLYVSLSEFQIKIYLITPDFRAVCCINVFSK